MRTASAEENTDLCLAVRGGGGNFGVVTTSEYRLHQVGPAVFGGLLIWPRPMAVTFCGYSASSRAIASPHEPGPRHPAGVPR
jgi:hypothetical protein